MIRAIDDGHSLNKRSRFIAEYLHAGGDQFLQRPVTPKGSDGNDAIHLCADYVMRSVANHDRFR